MKVLTKLAIVVSIGAAGLAYANKVITAAELLKHSTEKDCWMVIDGAVYDMSSYIGLHREECKKIKFADHCGGDATSVWKEKEASQSPHKKKAQRVLLKSKVGTFSRN